MARVAGDGDDVVEDDGIGEEIEEVVAVCESPEALFDDSKERIKRSEIRQIVDSRHDIVAADHAADVRRAKSVNFTAVDPVTFSMSSFGSEPWPEAMVSVRV